MQLYAYKTENSHNQCLIFTSVKKLLEWGHKATRLTDAEILKNTQKLTHSDNHYNLFPEV